MKLFDFSINTYYLWRKQGRLIFNLLDKYFSKEDLEEFIATGKVSKYEAIENNIFTSHIRTTEILKFLSMIETATLKNTLIEMLKANNINTGTVEYLKSKRSKYEVIKKIRNLLDDLYNEKQEDRRYNSSIPNIDPINSENQSWFEFEKVLSDFNDKLGFDFNIADRVIIDNIISRYKVYNTLYKLESL
jgi:hypothetical protein